MDEPMEICGCTESFVAGADPLERFTAVRSECPALRELLLPDEVWPDFLTWHRTPDDVAYHGSVLLLAFERGHLTRVTSALHRYLIKAGSVRPDVRRQYLKDLRERWMLYLDPIERHRKFRIFCGRLAELQFAEWLETQSWAILGLEALREGPDIEARAYSC